MEVIDRRDFLKKMGMAATGAALLSAAPWMQSCTEEKKMEVKGQKARLALIGTGSRGQYHIHLLKDIPHAELVALCDVYRPNLDAASALVPGARLCSDYREVLDAPDIDGVIVATPLSSHAPIVLDALSAGKHVFCEKAMALTLDECRDVYRAYSSSDRVLYYCMQRMYDEKYVRGVQMIRDGLVGDVVGMRCHWFRNADWKRPVPSPELERHINWRLYREHSAGLMTELACHQLEVCNWVTGLMPVEVAGLGDIVYWKDGREVYDSVNVVYRYSDGRKINYESLISNKFNGMEDQVLGKRGTVDLTRGVYYLEEDDLVPGIKRLYGEIRDGVLSSVPKAGPSWRPELRSAYAPHPIMEGRVSVNAGQSMVAADADGSDVILSDFCRACITGEKPVNVVEEAYCATVLCLLGNMAMDSKTVVRFPEEYKIPYMKFEL